MFLHKQHWSAALVALAQRQHLAAPPSLILEVEVAGRKPQEAREVLAVAVRVEQRAMGPQEQSTQAAAGAVGRMVVLGLAVQAALAS